MLNIKEKNISEKSNIKLNTFKFAFVKCIPIMCSYLVLSMAFGMSMHEKGFSAIWAYAISALIYTGTFQFVLVSLLSSHTDVVTIFLTAFFMSSRFVFYGLPFIEKFKAMGKKYLYMIFSITDENYSLNSSLDVPEDVDEKQALFYIALLCRVYWLLGTIIGACIGNLIPAKVKGIDFCITSLMVTLFIDQWKKFNSHLPALTGLVVSIIFLLIFGANNFILPSLIACVIILVIEKNTVISKERGK